MNIDLAPLPVLGSVAEVVTHTPWVNFHQARIAPAVSLWGEPSSLQSTWHHPCHFFDGGPETASWIFVLDVLNHCFWPDVGEPTWTVSYQGAEYSGYWGLAASLKRAHERGLPITRPDYLAHLPEGDLQEIFSGVGSIPLFEERLTNLREAGQQLLDRWQGNVVHLLEEARSSACKAVSLVVASFPSFRDQPLFRNRRVFFWKRAQLFVADLHAAFEGKGWGAFQDIAELTAFADYKLPQVLREMGIISYHEDLAQRIDSYVQLLPGGEEEIAIRAATIRAVDELRKEFHSRGKPVTSARVDHWLWSLGQEQRFRKRPYHRCRTIYY
jgi:hypothetical protein